MIRLVVFFAGVAALAAGAVWLADNPGEVLITWLDYEAETSVGILLLLVALLGLLAVAVFWLVRLVLRGPKAFAARWAARRRVKREQALVRGFAAVAIGEADVARRHLASAQSAAEGHGLGQMLRAQIAVLEDDAEEAEAAYRALLANPDTEFLGLRGLFETAARQGDREAALTFATRAFHLKPRSAWVAESLFRLQTQSGAWELAHKTIATARRAGGLTEEQAKRRNAAITVAEAMSAEAQGDREKALALAEKALAADPSLIQAAIIAAREQAAAGQSWTAAGTLESAWRAFPHPALAEAYAALKPDETEEQRARRLIGLAQFNGRHIESRILMAEQAIELGDLKRARRVLKGVAEAPSARVCLLMGEVEDREDNQPEALMWRAKAIVAPRDNEWTCAECGRESLAWHPVCDGCGGFDTFRWGTAGSLGSGELLVFAPEEIASEESVPAETSGTAEPAKTPETPAGQIRPEEDVAAASLKAAQALALQPKDKPPNPKPVADAQTEVYVPPRPPDDPGTEEADERRLGGSY